MAVIWRIIGGYGGYLADKPTHPPPDKEELNGNRKNEKRNIENYG